MRTATTNYTDWEKELYANRHTISGAQSSAICYSIAETAKANEFSPYAYLCYVLTELPKHMDDKDIKFLNELMACDPAIKE